MNSDYDYSQTSSPLSRSSHKSSLARAIAERRITASATYIPQDHPLFQFSSIPELPPLPESYTPQSYQARHTTLPPADPTTAHDPYFTHRSFPATEHVHSENVLPPRDRTAHDPYITHRSFPPTEHVHGENVLPTRDRSEFIMLYLTITGPPFFTNRCTPGTPPSPAEFHRAWASVKYRPESVREKRRNQGRWDPLAQEFQEQRTLSDAEVYDTDLRNVAVAVPLRWTHDRFWKFVRTMYSSEVCSENHVVEWVVECPVCAEEVAGYASDPIWNGRYIYHQENCCLASEQSRRARL
ncbi:hypothetical protein HYPSUDRAFT_220556 [Hypholoma sublateritium FD-334 SS-4]|uniref:Uncharacterized protein n=1 Tax=Hypholoma sublateritium (strain FD-334 SS-4) TaxID=945553 RepID=A0A0D2N560_HYPSF|nr:hypothetical protein HYPSUDRAFT_220556 [Hypholoma sublateritium FD-334 SS-4]